MKNREYLTFTRKEKTGIVTLLVVLTTLIVFARTVGEQRGGGEMSKAELENRLPPPKAQRKKDTVIRYVRVKQYERPDMSARKFRQYPGSRFNESKAAQARIDINRSDTADFIALPGIGSVLAKRIIAFRNKLGGFYAVHQIKEVYGISDSVFRLFSDRLVCDTSLVQRVDINQAEIETLRQHPYIRWKIANAVVAYRSQHGQFDSVSDLNKINLIDSGTLSRMIPYLSANN